MQNQHDGPAEPALGAALCERLIHSEHSTTGLLESRSPVVLSSEWIRRPVTSTDASAYPFWHDSATAYRLHTLPPPSTT